MIDLKDIESIFIFEGSTDMRCGFNCLSSKVKAIYKEDEMKGKIFIFCSKNKRNLKIIQFNADGIWLHQKRLEKGKFQRPKNKDGLIIIEKKQLLWLLSGLSIIQSHALDEW